MDYEPHLDTSDPPKIPLPDGWPDFVLVAILHVIALARIVVMNVRHWPDGPECDSLRLRVELARAESQISLLRREIAIKDARMAAIDPRRRPRYSPSQRMQILVIKAALGLNNSQAARRFQVTVQTIRNWLRAANLGDALVGIPEKVTRYPYYLRLIVQQLKACCPILGRRKIADKLARAGLHIAEKTVGRIINEPPIDPASVEPVDDDPEDSRPYGIIAKYCNHVWSIDITEVATEDGFWTPWSPYTMRQDWPFCWHVFTAIDHKSRRVMGCRIFRNPPSAEDIIAAMNDFVTVEGVKPRHIISDRGKQFDCEKFRQWCLDNDIKWRYGAVGKHGSIALIERYHRILKTEFTRRIMMPTSQADFETEMSLWIRWYNGHRPHGFHKGRTPNEVYFRRRAANTLPRIEPRPKVGHRTPCASPRMMIAGRAGAKVRVELSFLEGRKHLPIITVRRV